MCSQIFVEFDGTEGVSWLKSDLLQRNELADAVSTQVEYKVFWNLSNSYAPDRDLQF